MLLILNDIQYVTFVMHVYKMGKATGSKVSRICVLEFKAKV
jgi:hypothetical protein